MRFKKTLIFIILLPEIFLIAFFGYAYVVSPPEGGKAKALELNLPYPTVVAHRGLSHWAPEETRPAYVLARNIGAHYLELDVQRTKDGVLIAFHDNDLSRTTNVAKIFPGREKDTVDKFTYAELARLDAGSWFNTKYKLRKRDSYVGLKILKLEEVMEIAGAGDIPGPGLYIETKSASRFPGIERELVDTLRKGGWITGDDDPTKTRSAPRVILQSFEYESLVKLKELAPGVPLVFLIGTKSTRKESFESLLEKTRKLGAGIGPVGYLAYPWHTGPAHEKGLVVHPYTLNKPWQIWLIKQFGADGIFTDRADLGLVYFNFKEKIDMPAIIKQAGY